MATLISPGVSISITDESFYVSSGPGTVPLIVIATQQDKVDSTGSAIAAGTTKANAGKLWLSTSQRDLLLTFGVPYFKTVGGTSMHGYELNEYGLLAAHSYLGISNAAYVIRADIDTAQLEPLDSAPTANPTDGTYWLNTANIITGLYVSDGTDWVKTAVYVATSVDTAGKPKNVPTSYSYAIVPGVNPVDSTKENAIYKKSVSGVWNLVSVTDGSVVYNKVYPTVGAVGNIWVNLREASYPVVQFQSSVGQFVTLSAPLYANGNDAITAYGSTLRQGSVFVEYNSKDSLVDMTNPAKVELQHSVKVYNGNSSTSAVTTLGATGPYSETLVIKQYDGSSKSISASGADVDGFAQSLGQALTSNGVNLAVHSNSATRQVSLVDDNGKDIIISSSTNFSIGIYSNWSPMTYDATATAPTGDLADGTLWYSTQFLVDIMINDGLGHWNELGGNLFIQSSEPTTNVVNGDIWVDTDQLDRYPVLYKRVLGAWKLVDTSDQTTPNGIIFADARPTNSGALDADAPDALAYPQGMLLWNTRYSTRNVKEWTHGYTYEGNVIGDRWVSKSGLKSDGSPWMGGDAVKQVVIKAMAAVIQENEDIRSDNVFYNLIAAPGFPELIDEMVSLNVDRLQTAFVVGDTPFDLPATGTALQSWATNANGATENGAKGLITSDPYLGVYYPSGLTTDLSGNSVVIPPSHMLLRTMAYNDQVAYQWFAPAGLQRGVVSNATSVGYLDSEGEYVTVSLNTGLRDTLYSNNINPIAQIPNRGVVVWGQKTRSSTSSAMDRVNVARLVNYIRYQMNLLVQPFLFEPNDAVTRKAVKRAADSFLSELVTLRGLEDFLTVCDTSNNTSDRVDRNELWLDVAIIPVKAVEFIYIPIRILNTGSL